MTILKKKSTTITRYSCTESYRNELWSFVCILHVLDELYSRAKLNPPVLLLSTDPVTIETLHVLNGGQQTGGVGLDEHENEDGDEVIGSRHGPLVGHTQQVHDSGSTPENTLHLVLGGLEEEVHKWWLSVQRKCYVYIKYMHFQKGWIHFR